MPKFKSTIIPMVRLHTSFLPPMFLDKLKNIITSTNFPWYFQGATIPNVRKESQNNFMFTHTLFRKEAGKTSNWFETFEPILYFINEKIKVNGLLRMKLNLYTNQHKKIKHGSHYDFLDDNDKIEKGITIGIFNFITCDGGTHVENKIYPSRENEVLFFKNELKHFGITQTDTPIRIVLNIGWK